MSRSLLIGIAVTLLMISGLATGFYFLYIKEKGKPLFDAIPNDATVVLETKSFITAWQNFKSGGIWKDLQHNQAASDLGKQIEALDSLFDINPFLSDVIRHEQLAISVHASAQVSLLFVAAAPDDKEWISQVSSTIHASGYQVKKRTFEREVVLDVTDAQMRPVCSIACKDKLLLCSTDGTLVEESIRKLKYHIPNPIRGLISVTSLAGSRADFNLYINYARFSALTDQLLRTEYAGLFNYVKRFANWSVFNVDLSGDKISMSGFTVTDDSLYQFLDLFKSQSPVNHSLNAYFPDQTAIRLQLGFSDYPKFKSALNEYLQQSGRFNDYASYKDSLEQTYQINLDAGFENLIGDQVALGVLESTSQEIQKNSFALLRVSDVGFARQTLAAYSKAIAQKGGSDSLNIPIEGIHPIPFGNFLKLYFGEVFEDFIPAFYAVQDDVILFAGNDTTLEFITTAIRNGETLAKQPEFAAFDKESQSAFNFHIWMHTGLALQIPANFIKESFYSQINRYANDYRKMEFVQLQYASTAEQSFYTQLDFLYNVASEQETRMLWESRIDTTLSMPPVLLRTGTYTPPVIFAQDLRNNIYLLSQSGTLLWKHSLSGPIIGTVHEVDWGKNGSIEYLFNTASQTCLIDANGNNVFGYPVRFPGKTQHELFLTDFYGDSSFSWFVGLTNNRIAGYQLDGKPLRGWNPKVTPAPVVQGISDLRIGSRHQLFTALANGETAVFEWNGTAVGHGIPAGMGGSMQYLYNPDTNTCYLYRTDSSGRFTRSVIQRNGWTSTTPDILKPNPHALTAYRYAVTGEFFFIESDSFRIGVCDQKGKTLFTIPMPDSTRLMPALTTIPGDKLMLMVTNRNKEELLLFDMQGHPDPAFPVKGNGPFTVCDLMMNKGRYLISCDRNNNIMAHRLK